MKTFLATAFAINAIFATSAHAELCDYRPSNLLAGVNTGALLSGAGVALAAGAGAKTAGFYSLVHAGSGMTMLDSTASVANSIGVIAGSSGAIGSAVAFLMSPMALGAAAATAVGTGGVEGYCSFLVDERITEYPDVLKSLQAVVVEGDPSTSLEISDPDKETARLSMLGPNEQWSHYNVADLYIVEGVLMHRDWLRNTKLGSIAYVVPSTSE